MRKYKQKNPEKYYFNILRTNAKRRRKEFILTIDEFIQFCKETGYLQNKGKRKESASIDRIDTNKGYSIDNIQVLSLSDNSIKQHAENCPF